MEGDSMQKKRPKKKRERKKQDWTPFILSPQEAIFGSSGSESLNDVSIVEVCNIHMLSVSQPSQWVCPQEKFEFYTLEVVSSVAVCEQQEFTAKFCHCAQYNVHNIWSGRLPHLTNLHLWPSNICTISLYLPTGPLYCEREATDSQCLACQRQQYKSEVAQQFLCGLLHWQLSVVQILPVF